MNQFKSPSPKPTSSPTPNLNLIQGFVREKSEYFLIAAFVIGPLIYEKFVGFDWTWKVLLRLGKNALAIGGNLLSWAVAAVVVLCLFRLLWPFLRPFVCMAVGLIACWVMWRLGLF